MTASDLNEGGSLPKWEAVECRVYMGDGGISLHNVPNGVERARLIAAAPDLLEACQNFKGLYDTPAERRRRADDPFYAEAIEHLRAAISRATGEA